MNFELTIGRLHLHSCWAGLDNEDAEVVELNAETRIVGFTPNENWEDEEDDRD